MANRVPLIVDTSTLYIKELPTGDNLDLTGSGIVGLTGIGGTTGNFSGIVTASAYYVSATQVISSGRQLQNIASLDATTTATIESAIANAPNTFTDLNITGISTLGSATASSLVVSGVSTVSAGTSALPSITPSGDSNTGIFFPAADTIGASTGGTARITIDSSGNITVTNNLIIPLGTAALPSLAILSDPNTGIFSPGADQLAISTNGTGRLFISSAGRLSVGLPSVTSLGAMLSLKQITDIGGQYGGLIIEASGLDHLLGIGYNSQDDSFIFSPTFHSTGAFKPLRFDTSNVERMRIRTDGTFEIKGAGTAGVSPAVSVNPSAPANSFVIDSSGRLGLGTSSPSSKLSVNSGAANTFAANFYGPLANTDSVLLGVSDDVATKAGIGFQRLDGFRRGSFFIFNNNDANASTNGSISDARLTINSSGQVGIGTTGPETVLDVFGAPNVNYGSATLFDSTSTAANVGGVLTFGGYKTAQTSKALFGFIKGGKENATSGNESGYLAFGTNNNSSNSEKARIDSSGKLLVGTSTSTGGGACIVTDGYARYSKSLGNKLLGSSYTVCTLNSEVTGKIKIMSMHNSGVGYKEYSFCYSANGKALSLIHDNSPYAPAAIELSLNNSTGVVSTNSLPYDTAMSIVVECLGITTGSISITFP